MRSEESLIIAAGASILLASCSLNWAQHSTGVLNDHTMALLTSMMQDVQLAIVTGAGRWMDTNADLL